MSSIQRSNNRQGGGMAFEDSLKLMAAILAATVLGVNLSIVRPLKDHMAELREEVAAMQSEMQLLVGQRDQVRNTNDLLSGLKAQQVIFDDARRSLARMKQLRDQLASECQKTNEVLVSVEKLATLQQTVLRYRDLTEPATKVLAEIGALHKQLIGEQSNADDAVDALNRLTGLKRYLMAEAMDAGQAEMGLSQIINLKTQIVAQSADAATASARAKQLIDMKCQIMQETDDLDSAGMVVDGLLAMKDQLVVRGGAIVDAMKNAERLLGLRDRLAENAAKTDAAEQTASRLLEMNKRLAGASPNVAEAIRSVETLLDLQQEFQKQVRSLDGMRRSLMEIVMMESTVAQAVRMLQPILELGNLRHLNDDELRQVARTIAEQRTTRVSKNESPRTMQRSDAKLGPIPYNPGQADGSSKDETVPWPIED